jgi:hypothetical protein
MLIFRKLLNPVLFGLDLIRYGWILFHAVLSVGLIWGGIDDVETADSAVQKLRPKANDKRIPS